MYDQLEKSWRKALAAEFEKDYFAKLTKDVSNAYQNTTVYPPKDLIFKAFEHCPLPQVKVVILGQDPYHGPDQAMGLSFSVPNDTTIPPSLRNIYKEIQNDIDVPIPKSGNLEHWAKQGVLLLNATLTVRGGKASSHQNLGWETFTDAAISTVSREQTCCVFLLWGAYARSKATLINPEKHLTLEAPHPSPLSAHRGFLGCKHFSQTNTFLKSKNLTPIIW